jgi:hypothetical protein
MIIYNVRIPNIAAMTVGSTNIGTITPGTNRSFLILELDFQGQGTSSAAQEVGLYRTANTYATPGTALTFVPVESVSTNPSFSGVGAVSYTTAPTLGSLLMNFGLNANGQRFFWRANPNLNNAIVVPGTATALTNGVTLASIAGTGSISGRIQIAEL